MELKELFEKLKIDLSLVTALNKQGIIKLTQIQSKVIPEALLNKDLIIRSQTGSGKTLAYLLPVFSKIDTDKSEMQAIILAPTHELVMQIYKQVELLSENSEIKATATPIIGNVNIERQIKKLREKPDIIVGTPGRILELIKRKKIAAHTVKTIIVDEADTLTNKENMETIESIIKSTLRERQVIMVSASAIKQAITRLNELMKEATIIIDNENTVVPETIEHLYFLAEERDKIEILRKITGIIKPGKSLVFIGSREDADFYTNRLRYHGINASSLHGHAKKMDRKKAMEDFRTGKTPMMVVSEIAARGLDIEGVTHVFNVNIPEHSAEYLHRAGRTGRIGGEGVSISIITAREIQFIELFKRELGIDFELKDMFKGNIISRKESNNRL